MVQQAGKETMLTLALGRIKQSRSFSQGFTLLELMVVLVIVGISLGLVAPQFMKNDDDVLKEESVRLVSLIEYASDAAISQGRWLSWSATSDGYRFLQRDEDKNIWQPIVSDDVLRERKLPEAVHIQLANTQNAHGASDQIIALSPTGVHPPFQIEISAGKFRRVIKGNLLGQVKVFDPYSADGKFM